jgi:hypothetical protein
VFQVMKELVKRAMKMLQRAVMSLPVVKEEK